MRGACKRRDALELTSIVATRVPEDERNERARVAFHRFRRTDESRRGTQRSVEQRVSRLVSPLLSSLLPFFPSSLRVVQSSFYFSAFFPSSFIRLPLGGGGGKDDFARGTQPRVSLSNGSLVRKTRLFKDLVGIAFIRSMPPRRRLVSRQFLHIETIEGGLLLRFVSKQREREAIVDRSIDRSRKTRTCVGRT